MRLGILRPPSLLLFSLTICGFFSLLSSAEALDYTSSSFMVKDPVLAPAGYATSTGYAASITIGQPAIGTSTVALGTVREVRSGFEYFPFVTKPVPSAIPGNANVSLSWTASTGFLGWTVSGYSVGQSTVGGGPYTYTATGAGTSATMGGLTNGTTYYFVVVAKDFFGNFIATSSEVTGTPVAGVIPSPLPVLSGGGGVYKPLLVTLLPPIIPVIIPSLTTPPSGTCHTIADLNCDGYVDIIDFSIMYYWFDKTDPPVRVDLSRDGKINIADFSVMAYYWYERKLI